MPRTRCYRDPGLYREGFPIAEVSDYLSDPANVVWFDLTRDDHDALASVKEELGLHDLAIEDVLTPGQRPKVDLYPQHLLVIAYSIDVDAETGVVTTHEVAAFVTSNALVTVRSANFDIDGVVKRWDGAGNLTGNGVAFLLHGLLDYVVDTQYTGVERLDDAIDGMEDRLFDEAASDVQMQRRIFELRKSLVGLRRLVLPMREVVNTLMRRDLKIVDDDLTPYFQDVYDHVLRVEQWVADLRDLVANMLETRLTVRGNRLNVIMKKVTSWAAIIAVPTAVTGWFGQNLPYPGYQTGYGVWISTVVMVGGSIVLYATFKAKDWL